MSNDLRGDAVGSYGETQGRTAHASGYDDPEASWPYYEANYADLIADVTQTRRSSRSAAATAAC